MSLSLVQCFSTACRTITTTASRPDPFTLLGPQLAKLHLSLLSLLSSGHPALSETTKYYFTHPSKQIRPVIVLLLAQATNGLGKAWPTKLLEAESEDNLDRPLTCPDVLNDWNPSIPHHTASFDPVFSLRPLRQHPPSLNNTQTNTPIHSPLTILPTQLRLAQIVEMLHTASLLHDDVIDASPLRRGAPSAPTTYGNKMAVLSGNFILGRASVALARLGDKEVTQIIASVIADLVDGEILQMRDVGAVGEEDLTGTGVLRDTWNTYFQKTYLKTASLMAKGARSAVVLGGCTQDEVWKDVTYMYGRNIGIAFQLVDDILDYESASPTSNSNTTPNTSTSNNLRKPTGADLQLGLATGPALYAWEEHPEMGALIQRKFGRPGDVELARKLVHASSGVHHTKLLAQAYADKAKQALTPLPDTEAKDALVVLAERVVQRRL